MLRTIRYSAILCACFLMQACGSLTVREPICEPPPIPSSLMEQCQTPSPLPDGKLATLYQQYLADVTGPWSDCVRLHDQLIAVVKYRDQVCQHIQSLNQSPPKPWWKFWG